MSHYVRAVAGFRGNSVCRFLRTFLLFLLLLPSLLPPDFFSRGETRSFENSRIFNSTPFLTISKGNLDPWARFEKKRFGKMERIWKMGETIRSPVGGNDEDDNGIDR